MKGNNKLFRIFAFLLITTLIVTNISGFTYADEDDGGEHYTGLIIPPDDPDPGFIDPVLPPTPEPEPAPHEHTFAPGQLIQDSTCSQPGVTRYSCTTCNYYEDRNEPGPDPSKHVPGVPDVTVQPTCSTPGHTIYRCVYCGQTISETDNPPATGQHVSDGGTVIQQATCQQEGVISYHCAQCGCDMGTDSIPKSDHISDSGTIVKKPTATEPGEIEYRCVNCGKILKEEQIPVIPKRNIPQAVFDTSSCTLTNVPDNSTVILNGSTITTSASGTASLNNCFPQTGDYTIKVIANETESAAASDPQSIHTHKPSAPSHIQTIPEPATGGTGAIGGVDTNMEYKFQDGDSWTSCTNSSQPVSAGIYVVRYKATTTSVPSDSVEALVKKDKQNKPATPNANFDGPSHQLRNLTAGMVYSTNGGDTWTKVSDAAVKLSSDAVNQAVAYKSIKVKNIVGGVESDVQKVAVGRVAQPTGLYTEPATNGNNGAIKGTGTDMQYRKDGSDAWLDIGSSSVNGLSKGKYFVRRKGYSNNVESNPVDVYVNDKPGTSKESTPTAQFNAYNMNIDGVSGCRLSFDGGKNWTDKIGNYTYTINEAYLNTSTGIILYRPGNGSTTTDSDRQYIVLTKQPTPVGISALSATATAPGAIVGTDSLMQYKAVNQASWIDITTSSVSVPAGSYYLRRHGYGNALPSDWLTVVIKTAANVTPTTPTDVVPVDNDKKKEEEPKKNTEIVVENNLNKKEEEVAEEKKEEELLKDVAEAQEVLENEPVSSTGEVGWKAIENEFETATEPVIIRLNEATDIPTEVISRAAVTDTPIVFTADNSAVWSIAPSDIDVNAVSVMRSIDLGIKENTQSVPVSALASVEDVSNSQYVDRVFDIKHEGDFGFKAKLTVKVNSAKDGQYANLYWYNKAADKMEFVDSSPVNAKKEATFTMTHASSYVVVRSNVAMSQSSVKGAEAGTITNSDNDKDDKQVASETNKTQTHKKKTSPMVPALIVIIIALIIALVFVIYLQKKKAEAARHHHQTHDRK